MSQLAAKENIIDRYLIDYEDDKIDRDTLGRRITASPRKPASYSTDATTLKSPSTPSRPGRTHPR